jgi:serine/threonine protein kinase
MTAAQREIFDTALEISDAAERKAMLDRACAGQPQLRERIEALLAAHEQAEQFFSGCVAAVTDSMRELEPSGGVGGASTEDLIGSRIGPYKLLQKIGEGGWGVVFMAEQESPVRRRVALKIIKLGMDTNNVVARFEAERQALALMDHPNIARVLDAGATQNGRPFFVMELVSGIRITEFCDTNQLDARQRLELFIQVCHAIQHAHQKGIIHRDIKPSNILVTLLDGGPVPKVIDFGIAKALEEKLTDKTLFTMHGMFIGTPVYMSPEQAQMSGMDVDTRSDIYSLGALLYELLTGKTPFDQHELLAAGLDEMRRTLREQEPQKPSSKIDSLSKDELTATAQRRHMEPPRLRSELRGDLDWIVMKALDKDRRRRYATVAELAQDVERFLANEPVIARPPSRLYLMQKFVRRNQVIVASSALVFLALVSSTVVSSLLYLREREARQRTVEAEKAAMRSQATAEDEQIFMKAEEAYENGHREEADALLNEVKSYRAGSEYAALFRKLGDWHVANGRWPQALERFAELYEMNQAGQNDTSLDDQRYFVLLVDQGKLEDYDRCRRQLAEREKGIDNPTAAQRTLHICLLTPAEPGWLPALDEFGVLTQNSLDAGAQNMSTTDAEYSCYALALLAYRNNNFEQAVAWCARASSFHRGVQPRDVNIRLVLAMSRAKLGDLEYASNELVACRKIIEDNFTAGFENTNSRLPLWVYWFESRILLREAETLIKDSKK